MFFPTSGGIAQLGASAKRSAPSPVSYTHLDVYKRQELISVTGVKDVDSFNEQEVELLTEGGELRIEGNELRITKLSLDEGQVIVEGEIVAFEYADAPAERGSLFSRMFR